eukprot:2526823-Ditylum_brightwellii.AAC.1
MLPEMVTTILQQIKESTNHLLWLVKDIPRQTKPTDTDEISVLTQTAQGVSRDSSLASEEIMPSQTEEEACLLTQENVEKQGKTKLDVKSDIKKQTIFQEIQSRKNLLLQNRGSPRIHGDPQKSGQNKEEIGHGKK